MYTRKLYDVQMHELEEMPTLAQVYALTRWTKEPTLSYDSIFHSIILVREEEKKVPGRVLNVRQSDLLQLMRQGGEKESRAEIYDQKDMHTQST